MCNSKENSPKLPTTFQDHFFKENTHKQIKVPDYQRAFSWKKKQIELFIGDLVQYSETNSEYYFGHFISEDTKKILDIVDGQQRITTFVLFLIACRHVRDTAHPAYQLIDRFTTVGYDDKALKEITKHLSVFISIKAPLKADAVPSKHKIIEACKMDGSKFTSSQHRIALTLRQFCQAFEKTLAVDKIDTYIDIIMKSNCSHHLTDDKSVAVNIFEMHNTRGMPLGTMEIVKAKLMKYVYDHSHDTDEDVKTIQTNFGGIYALESQLSEKSFHGEMTLEQLFRYHLRVIDDGEKRTVKEFHAPASNASSQDMLTYLDKKLAEKENGTDYALALTERFLQSVQIMCQTIPAQDCPELGHLVGDVMILDSGLSCQFFLLLCNKKATTSCELTLDTLRLWEKLLYTCDFHGLYHRKAYSNRDNFELLFEECLRKNANIEQVIGSYVKKGFRDYIGGDLQGIVRQHFADAKNKTHILNNAYYWWRQKIKYSLYKYERHLKADLPQLRKIMRGSTSVEHILPQEWTDLFTLAEAPENEQLKKDISKIINGLGNLLLITDSKNSSVSNNSPADKDYTDTCTSGSYALHSANKKRWKAPNEWTDLIKERGEEIYKFILTKQLGHKANEQTTDTP